MAFDLMASGRLWRSDMSMDMLNIGRSWNTDACACMSENWAYVSDMCGALSLICTQTEYPVCIWSE